MNTQFCIIGAILLLFIGCSSPPVPTSPVKPPPASPVRPPVPTSPVRPSKVNDVQIPVVVPCGTTTTTAQDILQRMECVYSQLAYYHDIGIVIRSMNVGLITTTFETHAAHDKFRFEHSSSYSYNKKETVSLWTDGQSAHIHRTSEPNIKKFDMEDLTMTLIWGVGAGYVVPSLLRDTSPYPWSKWKVSDTVGTTLIEGIPCFQITMTLEQKSMQLWIGESDFLLRKLSTSSLLGTEEIFYETVDITTPLQNTFFKGVRP